MAAIIIIISLIFSSGLQVGYVDGSIVLAIIYCTYLFYGFRMGVLMGLIGGLLIDGARAGFIGGMSIVYLIMIGVVEIFGSDREYTRRAVFVDALILMVFSAIESIFMGFSIQRVVVSGVVFLIVYAIMGVILGGKTGILVKRNI